MKYTANLQEYIDMNLMEIIPENEVPIQPESSFYLPYHCVLNENNTTTKLRVVFDGSAKTSTNISPNDSLLLGPRLQPDTSDFLLRFQFHVIAISADIGKMYRQIALNAEGLS